ncbi:MAG: ribosome-associated translation inhibitor RaiA [Patescibacteria group bacterium]|jgi:ribosomal subunit interface protein|nr:ribosome-associated translation inhibitor RaiA [Patescibacteria group bacterium]
MDIRLKGTKMDVTDSVREYFQDKMDMMEKFLGDEQVYNCDCEVEKEAEQNKGKIYRAEVNLELQGKLLRVDKTEEDIFKAIDKVKDHMVEMIKKYKETR